jgi:hypothetical protein
MADHRFIGTWRLVSSEFRRSDDTIVYPYGEDAIGLLIYAATGQMAVQLLRAHRPLFAAGDPYRGTPEEIKAAFEGYIAYFGSYEVNEAEGVVTHHVHGASFPNWIGGDQQRFFAFAGNQLILSTPPILAGTSTMTGVLIWERVG